MSSRLIDHGEPVRLGVAEPVVGFAYDRARYLTVDGKHAYELSFSCGTCQLLFQRREGAVRTVSVDRLRDRLAEAADVVDAEVVGAFGELVAAGEYLPLLLEVTPRLVTPGQAGDYFAEEQVATWGPNSFTGLPEYPGVAYYRTATRALGAEERLFEFVVPMVPVTWCEPETVAGYERLLGSGGTPSAVALSVLDRVAPAVTSPVCEWQEHVGLMHFLLDGHHKMAAAASLGRPVRLLSLLAVGEGIDRAEMWRRLPEILRDPAV